jgi:hypothetical protein
LSVHWPLIFMVSFLPGYSVMGILVYSPPGCHGGNGFNKINIGLMCANYEIVVINAGSRSSLQLWYKEVVRDHERRLSFGVCGKYLRGKFSVAFLLQVLKVELLCVRVWDNLVVLLMARWTFLSILICMRHWLNAVLRRISFRRATLNFMDEHFYLYCRL